MAHPRPISELPDQELIEAHAKALIKCNLSIWQGSIDGLDKLPVSEVVMDYMILLNSPGFHSHQDMDMNMARRESVIRRVGPDNWDTLCKKADEILKMVGL